MRSLFSGVSALKNHQVRMDVIGNNIANVNTVGFKSSRVTFRDTLSQTLRAASSPQGGRGGVNPMQVGLGMALGSIQTNQTQGSPEMTGRQTDMAIEGNGFFVLSDGPRRFYTRAGLFDVDGDGSLISSVNGMKVMGWRAATGQIDIDQPMEALLIPMGKTINPIATTTIKFGGNLDSRIAAGESVTQTVEVFDSLGDTHSVNLTFTKTDTGSNTWSWTASGGSGTVAGGSGTIMFDTSGNMINATGPAFQFTPPGANSVSITPDFTGVVQNAAEGTLVFKSQDGYPQGTLVGYSVDDSGVIIGEYSNGLTENLAQIATAVFSNPNGLLRAGDTTFTVSANSGEPEVGQPGSGANGKLTPGALEMSNVDLSQEFTDMIITQRGFQANSRIITTSDEMLQELVNLKR